MARAGQPRRRRDPARRGIPVTAADGTTADFRDILVALCDEEVEFLIVGAFGDASNGDPHANGDVGVLVRPAADNAARVWRALQRYGVPVGATGLTENDLTRPGMAWQVGTPPRLVDVT